VIFPVIYAVLVWYATMRWRRQWPSFAVVGAGVCVLAALGLSLPHADVGHGWDVFELFKVLLWPYAALVGGVGLFIACLPRRAKPGQCTDCYYDLSGLDPRGLRCPECGTQYRGPGSGLEDELQELIPIPKQPIPKRSGS